jgi:protein phosphatase
MTIPSDTIAPSILDAISYGVGTDVGRSRQENQDSFGVVKNSSLKFFMVADGMGGVKGGAIASSLAIKTLESRFESASKISPEDIVGSINIANTEIFKKGSEDESFRGMGTTFVGLAFFDQNLIISYVGDSRAYRIRSNKITQISEDHTLVNDLLKSGAIKPDQAANHPVAHMLTRSLGPCPDVEVESFICEDGPAALDRYVICSDGLYNVVKGDEIAEIVSNSSIDEAIQKLINLSNERGGPDNITVIIVHVGESYPVKLQDLNEVTYPRASSKILPISDAYDIRATTDPYRRRGFSKEPDDAEIKVSVTTGPFGKVAPVAQQGKADSVSSPFKLGGLILFGLIIGYVTSEVTSFFTKKNRPIIKTVLINPLATELALTKLEDYDHQAPEMQSGVFDQRRIEDSVVGLDLPANLGGFDASLSKSQMQGVLERKKTVEDSLVTLTSYLNSLQSLNRKKLANDQARLEAQIITAENKAERLTKEAATASKNLTLWISRQKKLESSDPVDMASEVAFSSTTVKEKKELFEKATWAYLREVEVWRFNAGDKALAQRVSQLGKGREQRRIELANAIKQAVTTGKTKSENDISSISSQLNQAEANLEAIKSELEFIRKVLAGDDRALAAFKEELKRRLELAQSELSELEKLIKDQ